VDTGFPKRSCLNKKIERDGDSTKSHLALDDVQAEAGTALIAPGRKEWVECLLSDIKAHATTVVGEFNFNIFIS
jgi:hypothetical protein